MSRIGIDGRTIQDHFPGIGRYTYNLIDALAQVAPQQQWVVLHNPALKNTRYVIADLARHPNVELAGVDAPTFSAAEQWVVPRAGKRLGLNLLHSPYYIKPYRLPFPSVVTIHDLISHVYPQSLPNKRARILFEVSTRLALWSAQAVITVSQSAANDLQGIYHVPASRLTVTEEAADPRYQPLTPAETADVAERYRLPQRFVLFVGSNKPHKNLASLLQAWRQVDVPDAQLLVAGHYDARYLRPEQKDVRVQWLGPIAESDLPALYNRATAFAFPSIYEGFGLPVLEAMACGVPVVCSNRSSLPEVAGDAAILVDPFDITALAAGMAHLLTNEEAHAEYARRSRLQAARFSWHNAARQTRAVYERILAQ